MHHRILAVAGIGALSLSLAACASNPDKKTVKSDSSQQVCYYQAQIGSHLGRRQCMSRSAYDAQQKANHEKTQTRADQDDGPGRPGRRS